MPRPVVLAAVVVTAVGTAWAMWETGLEGPQASWGQAHEAVSQVWSPQADAVHPAAFTTAGAARPPPISFATSRPHGDRGACTACHAVVGRGGTPLATITSSATSPHGPRGVCTNCHRLLVGP